MKPSNLTPQQKERIDSLMREGHYKVDLETLHKWVGFVDDNIKSRDFEKDTSREWILEFVNNVLQRRG